jgi:hypothetical protein
MVPSSWYVPGDLSHHGRYHFFFPPLDQNPSQRELSKQRTRNQMTPESVRRDLPPDQEFWAYSQTHSTRVRSTLVVHGHSVPATTGRGSGTGRSGGRAFGLHSGIPTTPQTGFGTLVPATSRPCSDKTCQGGRALGRLALALLSGGDCERRGEKVKSGRWPTAGPKVERSSSESPTRGQDEG